MPTRDLTPARALAAIINDPRSFSPNRLLFHANELAVDALLRYVLREVPELGRAVFHAEPDTIFDHWWEQLSDICGGPPGAKIPTHMVELKNEAKYNDDQLDRYFHHAPEAHHFVVMPTHRAVDPGEDIRATDNRGHREMLKDGYATHEAWTIVTWEEIGAWLMQWLGSAAPTSVNDDPAIRLAAEIARVYGPCA